MDGREFDIEAYNEGEDLFNRGVEVAELIGLASARQEHGEAEQKARISAGEDKAALEAYEQGERESHGLALGYINGIVKAIRTVFVAQQSTTDQRSGSVTSPQGDGI
jgi:hypothetical protein